MLEWCKQVGVYSLGNRKGWTRDHKISVTEAIRNNYDPYYIRHPLNCELMSFDKNNKKKGRSSIAYSELVAMVDEYEALERLAAYGAARRNRTDDLPLTKRMLCQLS